MAGIRFLTAGESHGPGLTVIIDGIPAGLELLRERIDRDLQRRQGGYGRGGRMAIERDRVQFRGGVRHGRTLGGPIALAIENLDYANWRATMSPDPPPADTTPDRRPLHRPRPGHADLAGALKLELDDARPVLERASARETAARVAAGAVARALLAELGIEIRAHTVAIGAVVAGAGAPWAAIAGLSDEDPVRCVDPARAMDMRAAIDEARADGDTLGGAFEVVAHTPPPGLGHYTHWDLRLDGRIGQAMLSIPAAKSVAIGDGDATPHERGSAVHDPIQERQGVGIVRPSNRAGGIEGGVTNGEELRVRVGMKPLSTLRRPLESIDLTTGERADAAFERSDITVVAAAGVVGEAMLALVLATAVREKYGGDSMTELLRNHRGHLAAIQR